MKLTGEQRKKIAKEVLNEVHNSELKVLESKVIHYDERGLGAIRDHSIRASNFLNARWDLENCILKDIEIEEEEKQ